MSFVSGVLSRIKIGTAWRMIGVGRIRKDALCSCFYTVHYMPDPHTQFTFRCISHDRPDLRTIVEIASTISWP